MFKTMTINKSQIIGKKPLGVLKGMKGSESYKNTIISYIDEDIPILISTDLTQEQWDRLCEGKLTPSQRLKLSVMGVI